MEDYGELLERARVDVRSALLVWTDVLEEMLGSRVAYVYAKGSAIKIWSSPIDYVPCLSDLDIHVMLREGERMFSESDDFLEAMRISRRYEELFKERRHDYLHVPRAQIVLLNELVKSPLYVPPRSIDFIVLIGYQPEGAQVSAEAVRNIDYENMKEVESFLVTLPMSLVDRTGLDLWIIVRRMGWMVSPAPVRLLTQVSVDPLEVWSWNRTKICGELEAKGFPHIASEYRKYYMAGWRLFLSEFRDSDVFRDVVEHGYRVLEACLKAVREVRGLQ